MVMQSAQKITRIDVRTSPTVKRLLQEAATANHKTVSEYVLHHMIPIAEEALAENRRIVMDAEEWTAFMKALDSPNQPNPALERLLKEPGVFD
jgi:uncharacterized protein (DUF1778 family)